LDRKVSIIILNYNNWEVTVNCINSIIQKINYKVKIILIDNHSENNSVEKLRNFLSKSELNFQEFFLNEIDNLKINDCSVYFVKSLLNVGYGSGNNIGLRISEKLNISHSLIINSDILITHDFINDFLLKMSNDPDCAIISPLIINENGYIDYNCLRKRRLLPLSFFWEHGILRPLIRMFFSKKYFYHSIDENSDFNNISIPSGSCFFVDLSWFSSVNFFDSRTFLYEEEHILYEKILKSMKKVYLSTASKVIHLGGKSTNSIGLNSIKSHYLNSLKIYLTFYRNKNSLYTSFIINYIKISEKLINLFK
jgi:GT2 family glycosyltransferase